MNGLPAVGAAANVCRGYFARNCLEEIDGVAPEMSNHLIRGGFRVPLGIRPGDQVRWDDKAKRFDANPGTVGDDEIAKAEQSFVLLPHGDVEESVGAHHEIDAVSVPVVGVAEIAHRVYGVVELSATEVLACFGEGRDKVRMVGAGERNHGKAMRKRCEVLLQLVRRAACGNEMNFIEIEAAVGGAGHGEMAVVDGIERTAKERDAARMVFCGGAVGLGYGQ